MHAARQGGREVGMERGAEGRARRGYELVLVDDHRKTPSRSLVVSISFIGGSITFIVRGSALVVAVLLRRRISFTVATYATASTADITTAAGSRGCGPRLPFEVADQISQALLPEVRLLSHQPPHDAE